MGFPGGSDGKESSLMHLMKKRTGEGMADDFSILALRTPQTIWKGKKIGHWKMASPGW